MEIKLQSNIWKFAVLLVSNKRIFAAILAAYYLTIPDVGPQGIGIILLAGSLGAFLLEIPSGYLSDKMGHKQALVIARVLMLFSTLFFLLADHIALLILGSIMLSASWAFTSGTSSAFMHETLRGLGRANEYTKVMGKVHSIGFAVPIIFMVLIPFLVDVSYKAPFVLALVVDVLGLLVALSLVAPPITPEQIKEIGVTNFRQVLAEGHRIGFFKYALFSSLIASILMVVGFFRAPYQVFLEVPVIYFGIFFGGGRALASLMLAYSERIKGTLSLLGFYKFELILYAIFILSLCVITHPWAVVLLLLTINAFQWGMSQVDNSYLVEIIKNSDFKATLLSTRGLFMHTFIAVFSFAFGFIVERSSYPLGFLYLGILFVLILLPLYVYIKRTHVSNT